MRNTLLCEVGLFYFIFISFVTEYVSCDTGALAFREKKGIMVNLVKSDDKLKKGIEGA